VDRAHPAAPPHRLGALPGLLSSGSREASSPRGPPSAAPGLVRPDADRLSSVGRAPRSSTVPPCGTWISLSWGDGPGQTFTADFGFYIDGLSCSGCSSSPGSRRSSPLRQRVHGADAGLGYCRFFAPSTSSCSACPAWSWATTCSCSSWAGRAWASAPTCSSATTTRSPGAVAAAKKAFIVNRIGDLGPADRHCADVHHLRDGRVRDAVRPRSARATTATGAPRARPGRCGRSRCC
jgi:hypothetical protein